VLISTGHAQDVQSEKQIEVSLRMIGHQVLMSVGDSISRILPIAKENDYYRIQFESEFEFNPDDLVSTVDAVVKETGVANQYIVEVEDCTSGEIVYSFKMDEFEQSDIIPCKERNQPRSCYSLLFTLIEPNGSIADGNSLTIYIIVGLFLLLVVVLFFLWKRNNPSAIDPNLIHLGGYKFDKRNTELLIEHQRIELTNKEADLLLLLYNAANTTVEREVILNMVWGDEGDYVGRTLDVFISKLRKKLEFDSKVKIVNIRGVGYKLVMDD
jgi:uncharacterized protein YihD (DUF1040 family)